MDNSPVLLDPPAIDGSPAQAFASHKTRASAIAREYANRHPLEYIGWVVGDHEYNQDDVKKGLAPTWSGKLGEDQSIELIAHFQAASDDPEFKVRGEEYNSCPQNAKKAKSRRWAGWDK
jgi:hypothetical protein